MDELHKHRYSYAWLMSDADEASSKRGEQRIALVQWYKAERFFSPSLAAIVLLRHGLLRRLECEWPGVVRERVFQRDESSQSQRVSNRGRCLHITYAFSFLYQISISLISVL